MPANKAKETKEIQAERELRAKLLSWPGVLHGHLTYKGTREGGIELDPREVVDREFKRLREKPDLSEDKLNRPVKPILIGRSSQHYAFIGSIDDFIKMQITLIKEDFPFQIIGQLPDMEDDQKYNHANIWFDIKRKTTQRSIGDSLALGFLWFLGPASPGAITAVGSQIMYSAGAITHGTEVTLHTSLQMVEASHYGYESGHGMHHAHTGHAVSYHLNLIDKWMLSGAKASGTRISGRKKIQIDVGCVMAETNRTSPAYDSQKQSRDGVPLDISVEMLCLALVFVLKGHKPAEPFKQSFLDAVKVYVKTSEIPDYLKLRDVVVPHTVLDDPENERYVASENECYLASVLQYFHLTRAVEPLTARKRLRPIKDQKIMENLEHAVDYINPDYLCVDVIPLNALEGVGQELEQIYDVKSYLADSLKSMMDTHLEELMVYVKTGALSETMQRRVDACACPPALLTDDVNDTYEKACEFLYYMKRGKLPDTFSLEDLEEFKEYTENGKEPGYFNEFMEELRALAL
jgi:hypothetical protein